MVEWKIPLFKIYWDNEDVELVSEAIKKGMFWAIGSNIDTFEKKISECIGSKYAITFNSGTSALHAALLAYGISKDDEVIVPSFTFIATANAPLFVGARPVFADNVSTENLNISPEEIEKKITKKTKAIIVMHYGGYPCNMKAIMGIAKRHGLYVIEDAAHAPGAEYHGKKCGLIGDVGCFSFFSNKNLVTGEGGMTVTRNRTLAERIQRMRSHGMEALSWDKYRGRLSSYDIGGLGYNYRTTDIQSALGLVQLKKLDRNNRKRKRLVETYLNGLEKIEEISIPFSKLKGHPSYHLFPILVAHHIDRNKVMERLRRFGIQTSVHYPPVHLFSFYRTRFGFRRGMLPQTEGVSRREVTLPLHPRMAEGDVKWIAEKVREALKGMTE